MYKTDFKTWTGQYVRYNPVLPYGLISEPMKISKIAKVRIYRDKLDDYEEVTEFLLENGKTIYEEQITSHSFNLIDLLEKGDYVNGVKIDEIVHDGNYDLHFISGSGGRYRYNIENIKSIVTKEQFEKVSYKTGR